MLLKPVRPDGALVTDDAARRAWPPEEGRPQVELAEECSHCALRSVVRGRTARVLVASGRGDSSGKDVTIRTVSIASTPWMRVTIFSRRHRRVAHTSSGESKAVPAEA